MAEAEPNAVGHMLGLLGDEWNLLIIQQAMLGATRYGEFLTKLPISNAVLTGRLRTLTQAQVLEQVAYQTNPIRSEYLLTGRGRSLWPIMMSIWEWERRWVPEHINRLPSMHHSACGVDFSPMLVCGSCVEPSTENDIRVRWGPSGSWPRSIPTSANRLRADNSARPGLFPETMTVLGNRWSAAILIAAFLGTTRFGDFQNQLTAPPGSLSDRLRAFCANEVLVADGDYRLTEKGRAFLPVLVTALDWGQRWFASPEGDAVVLTHRGCGHKFTAVLVCDQCTQALTGSDVTAELET